MATVELKGVEKRFGRTEVIKGVDLQIVDGEFVVFVGPSGCGKSTLLRMIAGLEVISKGDLIIGGRRCNDVEPRERGIAMVFQSYALYPHLTVYENISFGLSVNRMPKAEIDARVRDAARILQLEPLLDRKPSALSGGQRQRVAIGRAITREPEIFLFDEPLSNLDAALRMETRIEIAELHRKFSATMIYVTHDQIEAMTLADKIVVMRDGLVQQVGAPMEIFHHPANRFVAGFIGSPKMNFLDVTIDAVTDGRATVRSDSVGPVQVAAKDFATGDRASLGVRPQHLQPADGAGGIDGTVTLIERLGTETIVSFETAANERLFATLPDNARLHPGDKVCFGFDPDAAHLFETE